ncbi:hypothetical protein ACWIGI_40670 [Nocardia sp. NPDC055321]
MPGDSEQALPPLRDRLRAALPAALKARDRTAVAALRSALAAIDNAEAVDASDVRAGAIEAAGGLGAAERPRRELTESDVDDIVRAEIDERDSAATDYAAAAGGAARAAALRAEAAVLTRHLYGQP